MRLRIQLPTFTCSRSLKSRSLEYSPFRFQSLQFAQQKRSAWTDADQSLALMVKGGEDVNVNKIAGAVLLRAEEGKETLLEAMGPTAIYNSVKAIHVANQYILKRRATLENPSEAPKGTLGQHFAEVAQGNVHRIGFSPILRRNDTNVWLDLKIVVLAADPIMLTEPGALTGDLQVPAKGDVKKLGSAIAVTWRRRLASEVADPRLLAMGAASVSNAVKGAAFGFKTVKQQKTGERRFLLYPNFIIE